jgi:hypothetical protein
LLKLGQGLILPKSGRRVNRTVGLTVRRQQPAARAKKLFKLTLAGVTP